MGEPESRGVLTAYIGMDFGLWAFDFQARVCCPTCQESMPAYPSIVQYKAGSTTPRQVIIYIEVRPPACSMTTTSNQTLITPARSDHVLYDPSRTTDCYTQKVGTYLGTHLHYLCR